MHAWSLASLREAAVAAIFLACYFVFAAGRLPGTRIGRAAAAGIGALLMIAVGALPGAALRQAIDVPTLTLLFAMMVVVAALYRAGVFAWIAAAVVARVRPGRLLPAVVFTSGLLSAFLVNDIVCLVLAPLVLEAARALRRDPVVYLLALAIASNIGSAATITGNPQNILIGSVSGIGYRDFLWHLGPVAALGLCIAWGWLRRLEPAAAPVAGAAPESPLLAAALPAGAARLDRAALPSIAVVGLVLAGFLLGLPPAWVAAAGAAALLLAQPRAAWRLLRDVDWGLLLLFLGLFLIIGGARDAGLLAPLARWSASGALRHAAVFTTLVAVLSNLVSNVPAVMLLKAPVAHLAHPHRAWLLLAMASTLAGNLTLTGSIANLIVVERVRSQTQIGFWRYFRAGFPIAVLTLAAGAVWLSFFA
ncbi:MAG TPA: SLC13 family permease [Terriglobales bacterium]|nr:SLC13 family permease [Terriglobales bacterium]